MARNDHRLRPGGQPDDDPPGIWRRLARLRVTLQDWLCRDDEKWAADRGYRTWRSSSGWAVNVRSPAFDRRHACGSCAGAGRHPITGDECGHCVDGVVTDPE